MEISFIRKVLLPATRPSTARLYITHDDRTGSDGLTGSVRVCVKRVYAHTGQTWNKIINIKQYRCMCARG